MAQGADMNKTTLRYGGGYGWEEDYEFENEPGDTPTDTPADTPAADTPPATPAATPDTPAAEPTFAWSGNLDSAFESEGWKSFDDETRGKLEPFLRDAHSHWETAARSKFEEAASLRKTLEQDQAAFRQQQTDWYEAMHGDADPIKTLQDKLDAVKARGDQAMKDATAAVRTEWEAKVADMEQRLTTQAQEAEARYNEVNTKWEQAQQAEQARIEQAKLRNFNKVHEWLHQQAPDVLKKAEAEEGKDPPTDPYVSANDDAFNRYWALVGLYHNDITQPVPQEVQERALRMLRLEFPNKNAPPPKKRPEPVPDALRNLDRGSENNTDVPLEPPMPKGEVYHRKMAELRKRASNIV